MVSKAKLPYKSFLFNAQLGYSLESVVNQHFTGSKHVDVVTLINTNEDPCSTNELTD